MTTKEPQKARILVIDDEPVARLSLAELLSLEGYFAESAASGEEALQCFAQEPYDLAVVDLKMPGMDGLELINALQESAPEAIIIMLTAHGTLETAVRAMRQGAHDYLLKPANVNEILASVKAGLVKRNREVRRQELLSLMERTLSALTSDIDLPLPENSIEADRFIQARDVIIDQKKHLATAQGQPLELTPTEFKLLVYLMSHPDQVTSPQELVQQVQGYQADPWESRSIIRVHIRRLRQKLEPVDSDPTYIVTVRGAGYMFVSESVE